MEINHYLENIGKYHIFKATGLLLLGVKLMEINVATAGNSRIPEFNVDDFIFSR